MEVKPGYKQTEVGVIPEDWAVQSLEGIADPKRPICYGIVQVGQFTRNGIPVLAIKNLNTDYFTNVHRSSPEIETPYARSRVSPGDVLISVKGTTGRVGIVPLHFDGNISRDIARLHLTDDDVSEFWFQMLQSETAQRKLGVATVGTTRMELSIGILKQVRMPRPPKEQQRAIAGALRDVDALVGALDQLIAKKRDLKQAAMQQLLTGQIRLPGFHGEWEVKWLGELAELKNGYAFKSATYTDSGEFKIITIANVQDGYMNNNECSTVSSFPIDIQNHHKLRRGDILISMTGNVGRVCRVNENNCLLNQRVGKLVSTGVDEGLLFFLLSQRPFLVAMMGKAKGGAQGNLSVTDITEYQFHIPADPSEQTAIAEVLSDMDAELAALTQRRDKTRALKQGMMQELLTGRTRLV